MARVPVVTSPCPLRFNSMPSAGLDFCGKCRRRVHNLDGMSDAARAAFFANCSGEVCVAYTVRRPAALASVLVAAAAAISGGPVSAQDPPQEQAAPAVVITGPTCDPNAKSLPLDLIVVGGTTKALQWADESDVAAAASPEIAEIDAAQWLPPPPQSK
jgi:hypothetical protein